MADRKPCALIVDDEPDLLSLLAISLGKMAIRTSRASNLAEARHLIGKSRFDFCLTDMRLPDGDGLELVEHIQRQAPETPVAVITAYGSTETAIRALKAGAFDFIAKPLEVEQLRSVVEAALRLRGGAARIDPGQTLLGESQAMQKIRRMVEKVARSQAPVHIHGETGTGKELIARLIHELGPRADAPFIAINCGAIPKELLESELFGHRKGSFTGAHADKTGLFEAAHGGTLFLDEVAELPQPLQVKLLRAIQEKRIRPVGETKEIPVDIRIISASNRDLREMLREGSFREDLYYRINVIQIDAPSLRQRREDIPLLVDHFLRKYADRSGDPVASISEEALAALEAYPFPGNVRELVNILERALALKEGASIEIQDLHLPETTPSHAEAELEGMTVPIDQYLASIETTLIRNALNKTGGNITEAAEVLGTTFRSLRYRIKKLKIGR